MNPNLFCLLLLTTLPIDLRAQSVAGKVTDDMGKAIPGATLSLLSTRNSSWLRSEITGADGRYMLAVDTGTCLVQASASGYEPLTKSCIIRAGEGVVLDFVFSTSSVNLSAVTVSAKRPTIEVKPGMMVVNVENSIVSASGNALEILRRSPGVQVDAQGRILLRGKTSVEVYVDGRPSRLSGDQLVAYLTAMTAEEIAQLELITQPSAKYDAAGTAGIINIRTRAVRKRGVNAVLNGALTRATNLQGNASARITYRISRWTLYASEYFNYVDNYSTLRVDRRYLELATGVQTANVLTEQTANFNSRFHRIKAGCEYALSPRTTIGLRAQLPIGTPVGEYSSFTTINDLPTASSSYTAGARRMTNRWHEREVGVLGRHRLKNDGEISFDGFYVANHSPGDEGVFTNTPTNALRVPIGDADAWFMKFPVDIRLLSLRADFSTPLNKATKLESGLKYVDVRIDNVADFRIPDAGGAFAPDATRSRRFLFSEAVPAAYGSISHSFGKNLDVQAGLRGELTENDGLVMPTGEASSRSYFSLFPTLFASYKADSLHTLTFSYGRRLDRPRYHQLNPARDYIDKYSYRVGNPRLQPQFVNNFEVAHTYKGQLTATLSYMLADGIISDFFVQDDITKTAYEIHDNIAGYRQVGASVNYNHILAKWWTMNLYGDFYFSRYTGTYFGADYVRRGTSFSFNTSNQFALGDGWNAEVNGWFNGPSLSTVFTQSFSYGSLDVAVSKKLLSDSLVLRMAFDDLVGTQRYRGNNRFANFDTDVQSTWDARRAVFSASYTFGKDIEVMRRKGEAEGRRM